MAESWTTIPLDDISTGETVTAARLNSYGNNHRFLAEVAVQSITADVSVTATTVGTANQIASLGAVTYDNVPHLLEFYCPRVQQAAAVNNLILRDTTTVIGTLAWFPSGQNQGAVYVSYRFTPSAASHTYNVAAWNGSAGTWTYEFGTGGTAGDSSTPLQGYLRICRIPT